MERSLKVDILQEAVCQLRNSQRDVNYSVGNRINNIVIAMCGARWVLKILEGTLYKVCDCLTRLYT